MPAAKKILEILVTASCNRRNFLNTVVGGLAAVLIILGIVIIYKERMAARRTVPSYLDATKDDPPRYDELNQLPPPYIVRTTETMMVTLSTAAVRHGRPSAT